MVLTVMGLVFFLCGIGLVCWNEWSSIPPLAEKHTPTCLEWRRAGTKDARCAAHHGTDWFGPATAELELTTTLDHQIGFRHD